ncbi:MAG: preprotein translocase subunit SecY [Bacteroidales bacterium]
MKKLIETIKNIFQIQELRERITYTVLLILVYRLGSFVTLPGVNPHDLGGLADQAKGGILGLINVFSGGAFAHASVFGLGIMPYISASIVVQLLGFAVPYFQRLQRDGESGRNKINQITRYLTVIILIIQGSVYLGNLNSMVNGNISMSSSFMFYFVGIACLTAGSMFVMWLGERITDNGLGNGISLIIMIGIISKLPGAFITEFGSRTPDGSEAGGLLIMLVEVVILYVVFMLSILLVQGTRRVPVQYAKRIVGNRQYGGVHQYIPLKVNAAGVMPIIFAQTIIMIPSLFLNNISGSDSMSGWKLALMSPWGLWHNILLFLMVVFFTYFYTAIAVNPTQMAEDLKKNGGFIPGVKPGKATSEFLDTILSRITLPGSIFLGIVTILPTLAYNMGVDQSFAYFFGGTSLLILVGVVLDTLQQIESYLLMRHYDGLMKNGRIKGRTGGVSGSMY